MEGHTHLLQRPPEQVASQGVQLGVHQEAREVNDVHLQPAIQKATSGLQSQQAPSNHHRSARIGSVVDHLHTVIQGAEYEDTLPEGALRAVESLHRRHKWHTPSGNDKFVVLHGEPTGRM